MKYLQPLILRERYYAPIEREINKLFYETIYYPLLAILRKRKINILANAIASESALIEALHEGTVYYEDGVFYGEFNSVISKELKALGAKLRPIRGGFSLSVLPPDVMIAVADSNVRMKEMVQSLVSVLGDIPADAVIQKSDIPELYYHTIGEINQAIIKTLDDATIIPKLTDQTKAILAKEWGENLELYIQKWVNQDILKLRTQIMQNTMSGQRANNIVKLIQANYNTSLNKAKFLARQETSLLMSAMRQQRYKDAGITRYKWSTSHDERVRKLHKDVNGKVFSWDAPPIVGENGEALNPGEDYNCRCVAIPIVEW